MWLERWENVKSDKQNKTDLPFTVQNPEDYTKKPFQELV